MPAWFIKENVGKSTCLCYLTSVEIRETIHIHVGMFSIMDISIFITFYSLHFYSYKSAKIYNWK